MKNFVRTPAFRILTALVISLALIFLTPGCLSMQWKLTIIGTLFLITVFAKPIGRVALLTHFFRIATGALFIFSGTIKSNDPIGFSYKLGEYFEIFKTDFPWLSFMWEFMHEHAVGVAIFVCLVEVAVGFMLLFGIMRMLTLWLLLAQIVFFTFLTFYSACYNKVTHCGCFGDFLKLTPWTSFGKDIVLLIAIAFLFAGKENIRPLFKRNIFNWALTIIAVSVSIWFPIHCVNNLPVWDFLPYKNGADICKARTPGPTYKAAVYMSYFKYKNKKTGEIKSFDQNNMPWQDTLTWEYFEPDGEPKLVSPEVDGPTISSYSIQDLEGNEIGDSLLQSNDYYFLLIVWDLEKSDQSPELIKKLNDFSSACEKENIKFLAVTHDQQKEISEYKFKNQALFNFAMCADDVQLKMMIRSNPGLMLFKGCTMIKKWHHNNLPDFGSVKAELF